MELIALHVILTSLDP